MTIKVAVITGVTGQDGSYLAELLLKQPYIVVGVKRRSSTDNTDRIKHLLDNKAFILVEGDVSDHVSMSGIINEYKPHEFYNLAAQSHVGTSFKQPKLTWDVDASGVLNILEAIRMFSPETRFYQASTSEMFGDNVSMDYDVQGCCVRYDGKFPGKDSGIYLNRYGHTLCTPQLADDGVFQDEETPLSGQSPYGVAKIAAHNLVKLYRESYGIHASAGILFNHESPRRGENFVTRKITKWIGEFKKWKQDNDIVYRDQEIFIPKIGNLKESATFPKLRLGNIEAKRDWGFAGDYVEGMWLMLQQEKPDDYVLSTGETHTVKEFLEEAFQYAGLGDYKNCIVIDPQFYRPSEVDYLLGCSEKAKDKLGWTPKTSFKELVKIMVDADVK